MNKSTINYGGVCRTPNFTAPWLPRHSSSLIKDTTTQWDIVHLLYSCAKSMTPCPFNPRPRCRFIPGMHYTKHLSPTFSFEFVPIPRLYPSAATYAHPCPPIAWYVPTHVHPWYSNCAHVFKNCVMCITRLRQVLVGSDNKRSFIVLASVRSASWLAYSLHPRSLTPTWSWMHGCTKPMPTHAHPWTIISHPCPPMPTHEQ